MHILRCNMKNTNILKEVHCYLLIINLITLHRATYKLLINLLDV